MDGTRHALFVIENIGIMNYMAKLANGIEMGLSKFVDNLIAEELAQEKQKLIEAYKDAARDQAYSFALQFQWLLSIPLPLLILLLSFFDF